MAKLHCMSPAVLQVGIVYVTFLRSVVCSSLATFLVPWLLTYTNAVYVQDLDESTFCVYPYGRLLLPSLDLW